MPNAELRMMILMEDSDIMIREEGKEKRGDMIIIKIKYTSFLS